MKTVKDGGHTPIMGSTRKRETPVQVGGTYELSIHGLGSGGEGVGRYEGFTLFVPGATPGDRLQVKVTEAKRTWGRAQPVQILDPSPYRVAPPCPVAGTCGGCQLQHIAYPKQLELKRQQVIDAVTRVGKLPDVTVHPTVGMDTPWLYRNKAQFPIGIHDGRVVAGFFAPGSHRIVDIESCIIQDPLCDAILKEVKSIAERLGVPIYDETNHHGVLRHVVTRVGRTNAEAMVVLVTNGDEFPWGRQMAEELMRQIPSVVAVIHNINSERTNVVLGRESRLLAGKDHIVEHISDLEFKISAVSFFQVNPVQTEVLYEKALEYAALTGTETVIDVYCGIGTISLFLARRCAQVIGIEWVSEAIDDAWENAARNRIDNVRFIAGDASKEMPCLVQQEMVADVVVLDPPRKGCDESVLQAIVDAAPNRIVYVSCNPASLARDLAVLDSFGYKTIEIQPVDMFPHTAHVESCALVKRTHRK